MKISILEGELHDYWVAMAPGFERAYDADIREGSHVYINRYRDRGELMGHCRIVDQTAELRWNSTEPLKLNGPFLTV